MNDNTHRQWQYAEGITSLLGGRPWKKQQLRAVINSFSGGQTDQNMFLIRAVL